MIFIIYTSTFILFLTLVHFYWKFYKLSDIPGPFCVPFFTYAHRFIFSDSSHFIRTVSEITKQYGEFYKTWLGPKLFFIVKKPEYLKIILNHPDSLDKGSDYKFLRNFLGNGLVTAPVPIWRLHRKLISPTMSQRIFTAQLSSINNSADQLIKNLRKKSAHDDILHCVNERIVDIFFEALMGRLTLTSTDREYFHIAVKTFENITTLRMYKIWLRPDIFFRFSKYYKIFNDTLEKSDIICKKILDEIKSLVENENVLEEDEKIHFLPYLVKHHLGNELSQQDVLDQTKIVPVAATETTTLGICFALTFLGMNEEVQEQLHKEIEEVVGDREITLEDLTQLNYLKCVIKESLRMIPPVSLLLRRTAKDMSIGKFTIPKDSDIMIPIMDLHRDEKYWPDPLKFDPARFAPENASDIYPGSYLPFSVGPRNCIGQKQAIFTTKILLANIVRSFKISTPYKSIEEMELIFTINVRPKAGFKISLEERL